MAQRKIMASFYDVCMVTANGKIIAQGVGYDTAQKIAAEFKPPARILQEFMDADGYPGYVERPYNMA